MKLLEVDLMVTSAAANGSGTLVATTKVFVPVPDDAPEDGGQYFITVRGAGQTWHQKKPRRTRGQRAGSRKRA
jgi:hypothetical protein